MDDWGRYQELVLKDLERLDSELKETNRKLDLLLVEVTTLRTKATLWGMMAGALISAIAHFMFGNRP